MTSIPFRRLARTGRAVGLGALALGLAAGSASAQESGIVTTAVPFLQIEPDSRSAGMGMTGVALADNTYAGFWNPAGLALQEGTEVSFTHAPWLPALGADLSYEYLTGKHSLGSLGTVGAHLTYFNLGEQQATDDQGNSLGTFKSYELAAGVSYGKKITSGLSLGTGARFIYSNLTGGRDVEDASTTAGVSVGVDLGLLYVGPNLGLGQSSRPRIGLNIANVGPGISYTEDTEFPDAIPTTIRFGAALDTQFDEFNRFTVAADVNKVAVNRKADGSYNSPVTALFSSWGSRTVLTNASDGSDASCEDRATDPALDDCETLSAFQQVTLGLGAEYWYNDLLALRGGYFYEDPYNGNRQFITFGAGVRYSLVGVDLSYIYALEENSPNANQLRFSLLLNVPR